jgi:hypothetical protein
VSPIVLPAPTDAELRASAAAFAGYANVDRSWLRFLDETGGAVDLSHPAHRTMLLRWLNTWGCRIRYPRPGEPAPFDADLHAWWNTWNTALPRHDLATLTDGEIGATSEAYAALTEVAVSDKRRLGPTAAAKALYALRPEAVMPWDAAIAARLYGARDAGAFAQHLRLGRAWAQAVLARGPVALRPGISLAKLLDEHLYETITRSPAKETHGHRG